MAAVDQNFTFYVGDTAEIIVTVTDPSSYQAIDLTGASVVWRAVRQTTCDLALEKASPGGIDMVNSVQGVFKIFLSRDETKVLEPGRYDHVAVVTDAAGHTCTVTVGVVTVKSIG